MLALIHGIKSRNLIIPIGEHNYRIHLILFTGSCLVVTLLAAPWLCVVIRSIVVQNTRRMSHLTKLFDVTLWQQIYLHTPLKRWYHIIRRLHHSDVQCIVSLWTIRHITMWWGRQFIRDAQQQLNIKIEQLMPSELDTILSFPLEWIVNLKPKNWKVNA